MDKISDLKKICYSDRYKISLSVNFFGVFTFFLFGPLELYLVNSSEFWFSIQDVIISVLPLAIIFLIIGVSISLMLKERWFLYAIGITFGLGMAFYLQGNFMTVGYGSLDGIEIDWSQYKIWSIFNTLIWLVCLIAPIFILKKNLGLFKRIVKYVPPFILSIQIITLVSLIFIHSNSITNSDNFSLSAEKKYDLSKEENIVVFVLDTFDAGLFNEIIEEYPIYQKGFADFTYFENTVGSYPRTKGALPFILTGIYNDNSMNYEDYIRYSYSNSGFYPELINAGYDIRLYTDTRFVDGGQSHFINNINNEKTDVSSNVRLSALMLKFTAFRYMPHILKQNFWMYSGDFDQLKTNSVSLSKSGQYNPDVDFYKELKLTGITTTSARKTFRFYHLNGAHAPFLINGNVEYDGEGAGTEMGQALGCLNIVKEYIDQLKETAIYDNTAIYILADHGYRNISQHPLFMVKRMGDKSNFTISEAPISMEDLHPTILEQVTNSYSKYGRSAFEIEENENRDRRFLLYPWIDDTHQKFLLPLTEYMINGHAGNINNARKTGRIFTEKGVVLTKTQPYTLGKTLRFGENEGAQTYFEYGVGSGDSNGNAWSIGGEAKIVIPLLENPANDLEIVFEIATALNDEQAVVVSAGNYDVGIFSVKSESELRFVIPKDHITGTELLFELQFPDAEVPNREGDGDDFRTLAVAFKSLRISNYIIPVFSTDYLQLDFSESGSDKTYLTNGWYSQEKTHRWASGDASMQFRATTKQDISMTIDYFTFKKSGETIVLYNNYELGPLPLEGGSHTLLLPKAYYDDSGVQTVTFHNPNALSPSSVAEGEDTRVLSIGITKIDLKRVFN